MNILVLNCGSSSAKFAVLDTESGTGMISGLAQRLGTPQASLDWKEEGEKRSQTLEGAGHDAALRAVLELMKSHGLAEGLGGVGHRVVHGGPRFSASTAITPEVERQIEACIPLGPLHIPPNLLGIRIARELLPHLAQVAVFDTAFHQTMAPTAYVYAVPYEWCEKHDIRRYGFHGTSHRFVSGRALDALGLSGKDSALVIAHLGNGCSLAAVKDGRSVDTTMGLTPLEGVMMGTRSGSIDPAIVARMADILGQPAAKIVDALNLEAGLLGVSGLSNDMRTIEKSAGDGHARARLALDMFCYILAKSVASMVVPLGRLDALVFTGGIGENSVLVRARVVDQLAFLGLRIDPTANAAHGQGNRGRITVTASPQAMVVATNEELMIAIDTAEIVGARERDRSNP